MISSGMKIAHCLWWLTIMFGLLFVQQVYLLFFCILVTVIAILLWNLHQFCFMNYLENCFQPINHGIHDNKVLESISEFSGIPQEYFQKIVRFSIYASLFIGFARFYMIEYMKK